MPCFRFHCTRSDCLVFFPIIKQQHKTRQPNNNTYKTRHTSSADVHLGTKRRGSVEEVPETIDENTPVTSVIPTPPTSASPSKETGLTRLSLTNKFPTGHRRRNTDSGLNLHKASDSLTSLSRKSSNADVIKLMHSELGPTQRNHMQRKASDLQFERKLKHIEVKLQESQDHCKTAVEIIGNLQKENEDLLTATESLRTELGATSTELRILEHKNKNLTENYENDTAKLEAELSQMRMQVEELSEDMTQKDMALNEAKEYQKTMQKQYDESQNEASNEHFNVSKKEQALARQLGAEKEKMKGQRGKIEELMRQLEGVGELERENDRLRDEMHSLNEMATQDLTMQKLQIEKMTSEIILLSSRSSALSQEKEDLMALLEERDYENQMLKTGYGLHREKATGGGGIQSITGMNDMVDSEAGYDDELNLEFMAHGKHDPIGLEDLESATGSNYESEHNYSVEENSPKPIKQKREVKEKKVADVTREYLHLTASVVNMKFPHIQYSSDELINKVKNYAFWEYHDMMVRIMKTEEQKRIAKQKEEKKLAMEKNGNVNAAPAGGMLGRFRNFFGSNNAAGGGAKGKGRLSGKVANRKRGTISVGSETKAAENADDAKVEPKVIGGGLGGMDGGNDLRAGSPGITVDDAKKKVKEFKDTAKKKITGNPSEMESRRLSHMEFKSVSLLERTAVDDGDDAKPKKPKQGL